MNNEELDHMDYVSDKKIGVKVTVEKLAVELMELKDKHFKILGDMAWECVSKLVLRKEIESRIAEHNRTCLGFKCERCNELQQKLREIEK